MFCPTFASVALLALRCLLVDNGKDIVLIETGIGNKNSKKFIDMFNIRQEKNSLSNTLSKIGYSIENITYVIMTHLHFDHAGGAVDIDLDGNYFPAFPNAQYYISDRNWKAGLNPSPRDSASYLEENYLSLKEFDVLNVLPLNTKILDGIDTYVVNGHTYGQQLIRINGGGDTLVFCSDLIPLESHLRLPWIMGYDLNAALTLEEKEVFLNLAADNNWLLFFYHDPKTVAVRIKKSDKYYEVVDKYERRSN